MSQSDHLSLDTDQGELYVKRLRDGRTHISITTRNEPAELSSVRLYPKQARELLKFLLAEYVDNP